MSNYEGAKLKEITVPDGTYFILDKPDAGRMTVTKHGNIFAPETPPIPISRAAARAWLDKTDRKNCKIVDGLVPCCERDGLFN